MGKGGQIRGATGHGREGDKKEFGVANGLGKEKEAGMSVFEVGVDEGVRVEEDP